MPGPGEAYHFLLGDRLGLWDTIPALLRRIEPVTIRRLHVSTLSFGSTAAAELLALVDAGRIGRVTFLVSVMFAAKNRHLHDELIPPLLARGHRAGAMRTHAKLMALELSDGRQFVVESSSNLRSCHCAEQTTVVNDAGLYRFHAGWMDRAVGSGQKGAAAGATTGGPNHG